MGYPRWIVDDAGEIVDEVFDGDRISVKRKTTDDYLSRTTEINKGERYIKVYIGNWIEVSKKLDASTIQLLNIIVPYTGYEDGILQYPGGRLVTRNSIITETGMSKNTVDRCIKALMDEQIIGKHRTGRRSCYTVNPYIFLKGRRVNKTLKRLFENSRWAKA